MPFTSVTEEAILHSIDRQVLDVQELAQLRWLRRAYEKLVPETLDPGQPSLPRVAVRVATVLVTDLRGYTGIAETFADDPAQLMELVNAHLEGVVHEVTRWGGVVEKFLGDGLVATFGARAELPSHPARALFAALASLRATDHLNRSRAAEWGFELRVGAGVATGPLAVGTVGARERYELGVLGDTVNVASRLVTHAAAGEILVAGSTYDALPIDMPGEAVGPLQLRGRKGALDAFSIRARQLPPSETTPVATESRPPLDRVGHRSLGWAPA